MITLKSACQEDAATLLELQKQAFAALLEKYHDYCTNPAAETLEVLRRKLDDPQRDYWFICDGQQPVGFACVRHMEDGVLHISPICLLPECQGKGWGHQAMALLEGQYPDCRRWELSTILEEPGLCRFYESLGYVRNGWENGIQPGMRVAGFEKVIGRTNKTILVKG